MPDNDGVSIIEVTKVTPDLVDAWARLMPQLSRSAEPPTADWLEAIVTSDDVMFVAVEDDRIVGSTTLVMYKTPTGHRAHIDDVVVDESMRGRGIARRMTAAAIERAEKEQVRTIELTTNPRREAANKLYRSMGFEIRETNLYRYSPEEHSA